MQHLETWPFSNIPFKLFDILFMRIDEEIRIYEADEFHFSTVASNAVRVFDFQESHVFEAQRKYSVASADH